MLNFNHKTPLGLSIMVSLGMMVYLILMSYNIYLPTILLLSCGVGYIIYSVQSKNMCVMPSNDE